MKTAEVICKAFFNTLNTTIIVGGLAGAFVGGVFVGVALAEDRSKNTSYSKILDKYAYKAEDKNAETS